MTTQPIVSLIIPAYRAEAFIQKCLNSIIDQTLDRRLFEVIIVINGPVDGTSEIVSRTFRAVPDIDITVVYEELASLSNARNVGIKLARGKWVTWVDVDDWISREYLEELLRFAGDGVVPLARVVDVDESSGDELGSVIGEEILSAAEGVWPPHKLWKSLRFAACKLLPTALARISEFDPLLRSGEDVAYFAPFMAHHALDFHNGPAHNGAVYYRLIRSGSMSRQLPSLEFSVKERIGVMKHLDIAAQSASADMARVMRSLMNAQAGFIRQYLDVQPEKYGKVRALLRDADLSYEPWAHISSRTSNLAIVHNFAPFADASAIVAAKRLHSSGAHWNVVSSDLGAIRKRDRTLARMAAPAVSRQRMVRNSVAFSSWKAVEEFCQLGEEAIAGLEDESGPQTNVYSRSMWPASHFLAALHKLRHDLPIRWVAEFSDPVFRDVDGKERASGSGGDAFRRSLTQMLDSRGLVPPESASLFAWAEQLPYLLADSIIFTNSHQMNYMLSYVYDEKLRQQVRMKAVVSAQPVPSKDLYFTSSPSYEFDRSKINIGYFGSFYENRGIGAVVHALRRLPASVRASICLHIFSSSKKPEWQDGVHRASLRWNKEIPYLDVLALSREFDVLLVTDADTLSANRRLNPYRPSKLSDYLGAGVPLWALYEPGSILSRADAMYQSQLGNLDDIMRALTEIAAEGDMG